ncbi:MAG: VOC family protein [Opitutales bacterium]|nr:VOC family protein [Opitutales bacterium]
MPHKIFVNLPVENLERSIDFFTRLGFAFDPRFTDRNAACMVIGENMFAMLLVEDFFRGFTGKEVCNTARCNEVLVALAFDSRDEVNDIVDKAWNHGGTVPNEPTDHGWMYQWAFLDPDGHRWEPIFIDESAVPVGAGADASAPTTESTDHE